MRAAACLVVAATVTLGASGSPSDKVVLKRAGAHVAAYAIELPHVVGEETFEQHMTPNRGHTGESTRRQLLADFAWVRLEGIREAIGVREVTAIDGVPVGADRGRLVPLLHSGRGRVDEARAILDEGAKHNLAPGSRNFNIPTFAFFLLHPEMQPRFSWKRKNRSGEQVREFEMRERSRPTVVRTEEGAPIFLRGRVWIDTATGSVTHTELDFDLDELDYVMSVAFAPVPALGLVLPSELHELYTTRSARIEGHAAYARYRRFTTGARLLN
jgi:hypothetical protein